MQDKKKYSSGPSGTAFLNRCSLFVLLVGIFNLFLPLSSFSAPFPAPFFPPPTNWVRETAWKNLFNGRNLDGWTIKCKPEDKDKKIWRVENGEIVADTTGYDTHDYVWLVSNQRYTNFILRLRFRAYKDSPGNSGVQIWSRYDDKTYWMHGPQVDINPPEPWRTGMIWDETKGNQRWICPNLPAGKWVDKSMANKDLKFIYSDEEEGWNDLGIVARNGRVKVVLNGITVNECNFAGILDDELHKSLGVGSYGVIALQVHAGDKLKIKFKDIKIIEDMRPSEGN